MRYSTPAPPPPHTARRATLMTKAWAASGARLRPAVLGQGMQPRSNKEAVSLKTLSERLALGPRWSYWQPKHLVESSRVEEVVQGDNAACVPSARQGPPLIWGLGEG